MLGPSSRQIHFTLEDSFGFADTFPGGATVRESTIVVRPHDATASALHDRCQQPVLVTLAVDDMNKQAVSR